jgi:glycosyltransferase involved in cell wall biosynthesis
MVLHIANDFSGSKVYKNLFTELDKLNINQIIYNPIQKKLPIGFNSFEIKNKASVIIYSPVLSLYSRLNYKAKIKRIVEDIESKKIIDHVSVIHAHTWYSDGGVAYELYKKHATPYIIAVRNTDLNLFFKYMLHLRNYGLNILKNASEIIFISPIYKERFLKNETIQGCLEDFKDKCHVIPNGIDAFWIENIQNRKMTFNNPVELLYVGNFTLNKNVIRLIKAVEILNSNEVKCNLKIIGSKGKEHNKVLKRIKTKDYLTYLGEIRDKNELKKIFRNSDIFTMPSKSETFGLVYVEAISQGLPILFAKNEGIDGCYESIGEAVIPLEIKDISSGITKIINNFKEYEFDPKDIVQNHNWIYIAERYNKLYLKFSK